MTTAALLNRGSENEQSGKPTGPCVMVLFGGAGDLSKRKLVPALFNLVKAKLLSDNFAIIGEIRPGSGSRSGSTTNAETSRI